MRRFVTRIRHFLVNVSAIRQSDNKQIADQWKKCANPEISFFIKMLFLGNIEKTFRNQKIKNNCNSNKKYGEKRP
nr:MAG TPA: hypothetical protein [Bacteriophage sp.]